MCLPPLPHCSPKPEAVPVLAPAWGRRGLPMACGPLAGEGCAVPAPCGIARSSAPCSLQSQDSICTLVLLRYLPPQGLQGRVAIPTSLCPAGQFQCLLWGASIGLESTFEPLQWLKAIGGTRGASRAITAGLWRGGIYFSRLEPIKSDNI